MTEGLSPGWYPHKGHDDALRYWDGDKWTDNYKPKSGPTPRASSATATENLAVAGVFTAALFPIAGFIIGFMVAGRGRPAVGISISAASVAASIIWGLILFSE